MPSEQPADVPPVSFPPCPVVGLGGSAGGLEALQTFFQNMPPDAGMAFVVILHLAPNRDSAIAEILTRHTAMPVTQVRGRTPIRPNHVYIIPPSHYLVCRGSDLDLCEPDMPRHQRKPVDALFRSLAKACAQRGIGVILSGTGTNGTLGLRDIKACGGPVLAQDPSEAKYDGMPRSAMATGLVDWVLPVAAIPRALQDYARHPYALARAPSPVSIGKTVESDMDDILALLRSRRDFDFRCYKTSTLSRRIQRRMSLANIVSGDAYLAYLRDHPQELDALARDLMISVTHFFRDGEFWNYLADHELDALCRRQPEKTPLRVWVPGCATGEEAYSLAMVLVDKFRQLQRDPLIQMFASDLNPEALRVARNGLYPDSIAADVAPGYLERFFILDDHYYRISRDLRDRVTFAHHNLISDPPFGNLDLISCRNLLIYLEPEVQEKVLSLFHFALKPGGVLVLGSAETVGQEQNLFQECSRRWRVYRRIGQPRLDRLSLPAPHDDQVSQAPEGRAAPSASRIPAAAPSLAEAARQLVLSRYTRACVLVGARQEIQYCFGPTRHYLEQPPGPVTTDLLAWTDERLRPQLRAALNEVGDSAPSMQVAIDLDDDIPPRRVICTVERLRRPGVLEGLLLVTFREGMPRSGDRPSHDGRPDDQARLDRQEHQWQRLRDENRSLSEQVNATDEEFKAVNEELRSMNEELQSANEELETSKEELQSLNEELITSNKQLEVKSLQQEAVSDDLKNLLFSTEIATLFLDRRFHIRRYTPAMTRLMRLIPTDVGRPFGDITTHFGSNELLAQATRVLDRLIPIETEISTGADVWYLCRITPYRTEDDRIDGVVITFLDITQRYQAVESLRELNDTLERRVRERTRLARENEARFRALIEASAQIVWTTDPQGRMQDDSPSWCRFTGQTAAALRGNGWLNALHPDDRDAAAGQWHRSVQAAMPMETEFRLFHVGSNRYRWTVVRAVPLRDDSGAISGWVGMNTDIHERKQAQAALQDAKEQADRANQAKSRFLNAASHDLRQPLQSLTLLTDHLADRVDADPAVELVRRQQAILAMVQGLLEALLDIGHLDEGQLQPHPVAFPVGELLEALESEFQPQAQVKGLQLRVLPCRATVCTDRALLGRILENLVGNAVKHTTRGKVVLGCRRSDAAVRIEVWDTGPGIGSEHREHIFEAFYQADNPARNRDKGLGLGLAIVQSLTAILQLGLDVRSTPGKGSMFAVTIPRASQAHSAPAAPAVADPRPALGGLSVLLIEDDVAVAEALTLILNHVGVQVHPASTAEAAMTMLGSLDALPDLVLSDYNLPGINGLDALRRLREAAGEPLPAILLTGDTSPDWRDEAQALGCSVQYKPISSADLFAQVAGLARREPAGRFS